MTDNLTRAELNIQWCQDHLYLPDGKYVGQKLIMADFMRDDFRALYDNEVPTRRAIISISPTLSSAPARNSDTRRTAAIPAER